MYNIIFHIWSRCVSKLYICGNPLKTVFSPCVPARRFRHKKLGESVYLSPFGVLVFRNQVSLSMVDPSKEFPLYNQELHLVEP
jgi:hypothetical protein